MNQRKFSGISFSFFEVFVLYAVWDAGGTYVLLPCFAMQQDECLISLSESQTLISLTCKSQQERGKCFQIKINYCG